MIYVVLGLIGAVTGSVYLYGRGDFFLGAAIGLLVAAAINQRNGLLALDKRLKAMEARIAGLTPDQQRAASEAAPSAVQDQPEESLSAGTPAPPAAPTADMPSLDIELSDAAIAGLETPKAPPSPDRQQQQSGGLGESIREFLFGGNLMVRVGVVVLLFGFAFLVKYAAARNLVPLEFRLTAAFAAGIGLLVLGWRLRHTRYPCLAVCSPRSILCGPKGPAANCFGQLAPLVVSHIAGWCTNESCDRMSFHIFGHVKSQKFNAHIGSQLFGDLRFAHPCGTHENKGADNADGNSGRHNDG